MEILALFANRYIRHGLTIVSGYLVHKGVVDAETAGQTVDVVTNFGIATILGAASIVLSKLSDKLKF